MQSRIHVFIAMTNYRERSLERRTKYVSHDKKCRYFYFHAGKPAYIISILFLECLNIIFHISGIWRVYKYEISGVERLNEFIRSRRKQVGECNVSKLIGKIYCLNLLHYVIKYKQDNVRRDIQHNISIKLYFQYQPLANISHLFNI